MVPGGVGFDSSEVTVNRSTDLSAYRSTRLIRIRACVPTGPK